MKTILVVNPPSIDKSINRDMAGGLGFSGGAGVVLPPLDLLNCVATLMKRKWRVDFIDGVAKNVDNLDIYLDKIRQNKYDYVFGNLSLPTVDEDCRFYKSIKKCFPKLKVIVKTGINYPKILKRVIKRSRADRIIYTECDLNIEDYLLDKENSGTVVYRNGVVRIYPVSKVVLDDLDLLPIPYRNPSDIDDYHYPLLSGRVTTMQTSRGCPYPCGYYCPYPLVQGTRWRHMRAGRIVDEMNAIQKLGINNILFRDATFTLDMRRIDEMCKLIIKRHLKISWWSETRINVLNEELLLVMKKAGCQGINVGVETMDSELIKSEGKPGVSLEDVIRINKAAKKIGIKLHFLMIVGLPNDKLGGLLKSLEYLWELKPESLGVTSITPYPGTKLFEAASKQGMISNFDWNSFNGNNSNMRTKYLSEGEIELVRKLIIAGVYFDNRQDILGWAGKQMIWIIMKMWKIIKKQ